MRLRSRIHHADHLFGLDDSRLFSEWIGGPVPVLLRAGNRGNASGGSFSYAFEPVRNIGRPGSFPSSQFNRVAPGVEFEVLGQQSCRSGWSTVRSRCWDFALERWPIALMSAESPTRAGRSWRGWTCWSWMRFDTSRIRRTFR